MKPAIIYMLEVLVCSGVLLAAYAILLERRVKFRWCRLYLLLTTFAAALIPLLRIPVWPGRVVAAAPATPPDLPVWTGEVLPDEGGSFAVTPEIFCLGLYLLGAVLIAGVMAWQVFRIHRPRQYDRQNTPQPSLPQRPPDKQPAAATRPKTAYANRR